MRILRSALCVCFFLLLESRSVAAWFSKKRQAAGVAVPSLSPRRPSGNKNTNSSASSRNSNHQHEAPVLPPRGGAKAYEFTMDEEVVNTAVDNTAVLAADMGAFF